MPRVAGTPIAWGSTRPPDAGLTQPARCCSLRAHTGSPVADGRLTAGARMIKVLKADDHPFARSALHDILAGTADIQVVAECADGSEVGEAAARSEREVVLMDLVMPRMSGLEATRALQTTQPDGQFIVLTGTVSA